MLDIAHLFVGSAWAQAPGAAPASSTASLMASMTNFMPLILIFAVFYLLIIRPQQKKVEEQNKMIKALQRGDRVITSGGIFGKVTKLEDDALTIEIADNVNIKVLRAQIQSLAAKPSVTTIANDGGSEDKKS